MNWPLFWAITLAFGMVISNIMLLRHAAKLQLPKLKAEKSDSQPQTAKSTAINSDQSEHDQKPNTPA